MSIEVLHRAGSVAHASDGLKRPYVSIVAPCYNEQESLPEFHRRVSEVCRKECGDDYEIVLVNDGSRDSTWPLMCAMAEKDKHIVAVGLSRNHGHQLALTAGLNVCRGERILILDADLQDPPELLGDMLKLMDQGNDVVYGQRASRAGETWFKKATAKAFYRVLNRMVDVDMPMDVAEFQLLSRRALDVLNSMPEQHRFVSGMIGWIGFKQVPLSYERNARFAGETKYPFATMLALAFDAITGFSVRPLKIASYFAGFFAVAGFLLFVYALYSWIAHDAVEGWTSLIMVVVILGSANMLVLGVIGEYLGRLYMESKQRPLFLIDRVVRGSEKAGP
jgi:glycosyltransferase involved in cell wall biosynthesis